MQKKQRDLRLFRYYFIQTRTIDDDAEKRSFISHSTVSIGISICKIYSHRQKGPYMYHHPWTGFFRRIHIWSSPLYSSYSGVWMSGWKIIIIIIIIHLRRRLFYFLHPLFLSFDFNHSSPFDAAASQPPFCRQTPLSAIRNNTRAGINYDESGSSSSVVEVVLHNSQHVSINVKSTTHTRVKGVPRNGNEKPIKALPHFFSIMLLIIIMPSEDEMWRVWNHEWEGNTPSSSSSSSPSSRLLRRWRCCGRDRTKWHPVWRSTLGSSRSTREGAPKSIFHHFLFFLVHHLLCVNCYRMKWNNG